MKKTKKRVWIFSAIITGALSLLIYLFTPYFVVNHLTEKYGAEFGELYSENGFYSDIEYLKIIQYRNEKVNFYFLDNEKLNKELSDLDNNYAVVLYVEENHSSASLFIFCDESGQWKFVNWNLIWSVSGTADGFMWPYYF